MVVTRVMMLVSMVMTLVAMIVVVMLVAMIVVVVGHGPVGQHVAVLAFHPGAIPFTASADVAHQSTSSSSTFISSPPIRSHW